MDILLNIYPNIYHPILVYLDRCTGVISSRCQTVQGWLEVMTLTLECVRDLQTCPLHMTLTLEYDLDL